MSEFIYKLNAMEMAALADQPSEHNFKDKRAAVLAYVEAQDAQITKLKEQVESLKADAERYRWLRQGDNDELVMREYTGALVGWYLPRREILDEAIDMALKGDAVKG